jgi:hypothetical protein
MFTSLQLHPLPHRSINEQVKLQFSNIYIFKRETEGKEIL